MISTYKVVSGFGKKCLLQPACSLNKTLLAFTLLHFVLPTCLLFWVSLDFLLLQCNPPMMRQISFLMLVLEGVVSLHRTSPLQLLWHQWFGHRFILLWCWMVCLGNEPRSFCLFWDQTQVLHFGLFCWLWGLFHFFYGILAHNSRYIGHTHSRPF